MNIFRKRNCRDRCKESYLQAPHKYPAAGNTDMRRQTSQDCKYIYHNHNVHDQAQSRLTIGEMQFLEPLIL